MTVAAPWATSAMTLPAALYPMLTAVRGPGSSGWPPRCRAIDTDERAGLSHRPEVTILRGAGRCLDLGAPPGRLHGTLRILFVVCRAPRASFGGKWRARGRSPTPAHEPRETSKCGRRDHEAPRFRRDDDWNAPAASAMPALGPSAHAPTGAAVCRRCRRRPRRYGRQGDDRDRSYLPHESLRGAACMAMHINGPAIVGARAKSAIYRQNIAAIRMDRSMERSAPWYDALRIGKGVAPSRSSGL